MTVFYDSGLYRESFFTKHTNLVLEYDYILEEYLKDDYDGATEMIIMTCFSSQRMNEPNQDLQIS